MNDMKRLIVSLLIFIPLHILSGQDKNQKTYEPERPWMIGLQFGGSSLLASSAHYEFSLISSSRWSGWPGFTPQLYPNYSKQVNHGLGFKSDIYRMYSNSWGLGLKYSFSTFTTQNDFVYGRYWILMKQKQYIHFVGPTVIFRQSLSKNQKLQLIETFSAGYFYYRDEVFIDTLFTTWDIPFSHALVEGNTWAVNAGLSLEYYPVSRLSIGANAGFMYARLKKVDVTTVHTGHKTSTLELGKQPLSLLDCSVSIRYYFNN